MDGIDKAGGSTDVARLASTATILGAKPATTDQPVEATASVAASTDSNLISLLADAAPPIDSKTVEAIQSLIAAGAYPIDPRAIAAKMLALDFPARGPSADA